MQGILLKRKMQGGAYSTPVLWVINVFHRKYWTVSDTENFGGMETNK
jgi:hypothetical protein